MKRLVSLAVVAALFPIAAKADMLELRTISTYLNDLDTATAAFTQINDDGTLSTGQIFIKRPGRVRFEYDPPDAAMVVASAGAVVIFDPKSNQPPETYPLRRTPLSLILAETVDLGRADMVVGHGFDGTATTVTAQDPQHPEYGQIEMKFTGLPVELRQWVIRDAGGSATTIILGQMNTGAELSSSLFDTGNIGVREDR